MLCQAEFISDSKCLVVSWAISCRICNCVRMSLRGTRQSQHAIHYYFIYFFVGTSETLALAGGFCFLMMGTNCKSALSGLFAFLPQEKTNPSQCNKPVLLEVAVFLLVFAKQFGNLFFGKRLRNSHNFRVFINSMVYGCNGNSK